MGSRIAIRSSYSLLWGTSTPAEIVSYLAKEGVSTVGITDINNLYGLHNFIEAAKESNINYLIASQLNYKNFTIFAFVANLKGYKNLCSLLTSIKQINSFDVIDGLIKSSEGLYLVVKEKELLELLHKKVEHLFAAITPIDNQNLLLARKLKIPLVAIDDATFLCKEDFETHKILRSIATSKTLGTLLETDCEKKDSIILSQAEFVSSFSSYPDALLQTEEIANRCKNFNPFVDFVFPSYKCEKYSCFDLLRARVYKKAEKRYGELSDSVLERIEYELDIINQKGFSSYFLVMDDIVSSASRSCGRGSAASSIVSYILGITNVDPIEHELYFERFLNSARNDPPDIDVDFAWDERDGIINEVIKHFGSEHCARVANHNHFNWASAFRETAKAYGFSESQISHFKKNKSNDSLYLEIYEKAKKLIGLIRTISMHCGALVITPNPINQYAPVEFSREGYPLLGWEKEGVEQAKLVKIDLLGNRSLAVIRDTLQSLKKENIIIDENNWAVEEDPLVLEALARGASMGVFYIESPAMRQLQIKSGKGDFKHVVIHSSLIRPAASSLIGEYLKRLKGSKWEALDEKLEVVLKESYGLLCYQEDISKIAISLANFSEAEADALRKVITKKNKTTKLAHYEELFKERCLKNNVSVSVIEKIWQMMLSFEGYSFCKAHSASYAKVSFQSAYLKVHHKNHFMAAVLSNNGGYYPPIAYIGEARRMKIPFYGPDINLSNYHYYPLKDSIVIGFMAISNLSISSIRKIEYIRSHHKEFSSLKEAAALLQLNRDDYVALVASGSFDSIADGLSRSQQLKKILTTTKVYNNQLQRELLFDQEAEEKALIKQTVYKSRADLFNEFSFLGFLRDYHLLYLFQSKINKVNRILAKDLGLFVGEVVNLVGILITSKTISTKKGKRMEFVSFEDESDLFEAVLFPNIYLKIKHLLSFYKPFVIKGRINKDQGALNVEVFDLFIL